MIARLTERAAESRGARQRLLDVDPIHYFALAEANADRIQNKLAALNEAESVLDAVPGRLQGVGADPARGPSWRKIR